MHKKHVLAWDFICNFAQGAGKLRIFKLIDECVPECLRIHADCAIKVAGELRVLKKVIDCHGPPAFIRSDNGPECIVSTIRKYLEDSSIETIYIELGCTF